ncbi:hypothetical protein [Citromicrobium bathyomarinum]|uniref:hypothetical protein n=1 Tax=Citromicrobium bathyomarinum TaxID=72174 RepID=UPI00315A16DF
MTYDPLENLLVSAWKELAQYMPEEASHAALYLDLERLAEETDDKGNPTPQAHRAKARVRNAFLVEETNAKSKGKVLKNQAKLEKELVDAVSNALKLMVAARANAAKIAHIDSIEERQMAVSENREQHDPESKFALASPFIDKLARAGTSPSAIGRMPALMVSFIALLIRDHSADPRFQNPDNVWNRIVQSGILEAYLGNLDEEHLKVVAQAACERDEQTNEWAKKAREELDLPAGMDDRFLEGVARMRDAARSLTEGEVRAYYDAYKLQDNRDVDRLAKLLQMESQEDRIRLRAMYDFIIRSSGPLKRDWKVEMHLGILKREIDAIAPHAKWHKDWKAELRERLEITFERLDTMTSVEAFNALLKSGLAVSDADWQFTKRLERDVLDGHFIAFENEVRAACKSDRYFKIYDNRVVYSHELDFEAIETETWTGYDWLQEYGEWPGEDTEDRELSDKISDSTVANTTARPDGEEGPTDDGSGPMMLLRDSDGEGPVGSASLASEAVDVGRVEGPSQQSAPCEPTPVNASVPDATGAAPTIPEDHTHESAEPVDDDFVDGNPDDYDWHDENPDLEPMHLAPGPELQDNSSSSDRPSDACVDEDPTGPSEQREPGDAPPEAISSRDDQAADRPLKPRPYRPHTDHEEDDWNE